MAVVKNLFQLGIDFRIATVEASMRPSIPECGLFGDSIFEPVVERFVDAVSCRSDFCCMQDFFRSCFFEPANEYRSFRTVP